MFNQSFNNMNGKTTFLAKAFMMLFAVLFSLTGARAQQALPYSYGFEDNDLTVDGWELQGATNANTGITEGSKRNGSYGFQFNYSETGAYLVSPLLDSGEAEVAVTFYYKEGSSQWGDEQFQVGYTTDGTVTDATQFTFYDDVVTASMDWQNYTNQFPAGTKRIAIKYIYNDAYRFYLDDFSFSAFSGVATPKGLEVLYDGGLEATVRWISDEDLFDISVNDVVTEDVENGYALTGLNYATEYTVKVRAKKNGIVSDWTNPVTFHTEFEEGTCNIKLELTDSYGDSWNGNAINVIDVLSGIVIGTYTNDGSTSKDPQTFYVEVPDKRTIQFTWKAGSYASECSYVAYDINEEVIFSGSGAFTDPVTYTVDCTPSPWRAPSDLAASEIGAFSVKLSWTENSLTPATSWVVAYYDENATSQEDIQYTLATTNPFVLEGLTPETQYTVAVSPNTGDETIIKFSDPIQFTTIEQFVTPTDVAASAGATTATISWNGDNDNYTVRYAELPETTKTTATIILTAHDVWGDGSGYQMVLDADASTYGTTYNPSPGEGESSWNATDYSEFEFTIPEGAEYNTETTSVVVDGSVTLEIPAGTYDWFILNPTPGDKVYLAADYGDISTKQDDYVFEAGKIYEFTMELTDAGYDGVFVNIKSDVDESTLDWTTVNNVTSPYTIEGLTPETNYIAQVQAVYDEGVSKWASTTFTTLNSNPVPFDVVVTPAHNSATIEWKGESDSYEVKYRIPAHPNYLLLEDFESVAGTNALPEGWTSVDSDGDGNNWFTFTPSTINDGSGNPTVFGTTCATSASYNSAALTPDNWLITPQIDLGGTLSMWVRGQDPSWAGEKFTVYISTVTELADVSTDFVELIPEATASATYVEYTADLSEYAGKKGYIAIRHHDITDMFRLNVDNISIYDGETPASEWITITTTETSVELTGLDMDTEYEYMITGITGESSASTEIASFTTLSENDKFFVTDGDWDFADNWIPEGVPTATDKVTIQANAIIQPNVKAEANEITIDGGSLTIKDGAYLVHNNEGVVATVEKEIEAGKYYLVTVPLKLYDAEDNATPLDPADVEGMLTGDYDLYSFDFTQVGEEWRNYKAEPFALQSGISYLYANSEDVTLKFTGELVPVVPSGYVNYATGDYAAYTEDELPWANWNLGGSPNVDSSFLTNALYTSSGLGIGDQLFYAMNEEGNAIVAVGEGNVALVEPTEGMFFVTTASNNVLCYSSEPFEYNESTEDPVMALPEHGLTTHQDATPLVVYELEDMQEGSMNISLLEELDGSIVNIKLADRVLYMDGTWNTICLPFSLDEGAIANSPLAGADIRTLDNVVEEGTLVTLNFTEEGAISTIEAGKPYIVKWAGGDNVISPIFKDVTVENTLIPIECTVTGAEAAASIKFKGTYDLYEFYEDDNSILFIGEDNKFYYPLEGAKIGACRGYFQLNGITAGDDESGAKQFVLNFGDDATSIATISTNKSEGNWYDLSGRMVGKLNQKGIYVTEGRKVTVK